MDSTSYSTGKVPELADENARSNAAKADLRQGLTGVRQAIDVLRVY